MDKKQSKKTDLDLYAREAEQVHRELKAKKWAEKKAAKGKAKKKTKPPEVLPGQLALDFSKISVISWHVAHAYTINEAASYGGGNHIVVDQDFVFGRLKRKQGDPLCRTRAKFKALYLVEDWQKPNCKKCLEIADRLNKEIAFIGARTKEADHLDK